MAKIKPNLSKKPKKSSDWEIVDIPIAQTGTQTGYSWSTNTAQAPKQQVVNTENVNTTKTQAKEVKPSFINTLIDYNLHPKEGQKLEETLMTDAIAIAPFFKDFPGYKKLAYNMASQNHGATRNPIDIWGGSGQYDGTWKYEEPFDEKYPYDRNLLKNYIYGDTSGFEKNNLPPIRLDRFQKKYGDIPSYDMYSNVSKKDSININDIFKTSQFRDKLNFPIKKEFLDDLFKKNNDTIPIPFEEINPYNTTDDVAGHMGYLMRDPKNNDNINFRIQDIWKFDPDDYSKKWTTDGEEIETYVQAKAMEAAGKPFILSRQNPVKFPNTKETKTKEQIQLENDLAGEDAFFNSVKKQKSGGKINPNWEILEDGGDVNTLEGDLISKVLMERNRDKDFVQRAFAVGQYPGSEMFTQFDDFGTRATHEMGWGEDDMGQSYMFPTIMNDKNEAIKVPNQYSDYISEKGYKKATGMKNGGSIPMMPDGGGNIQDQQGYLASNLQNFTPKKVIKGNKKGTVITTDGMLPNFPILANGKTLFPNTGEYYFPESSVTEYPIMQTGGRPPLKILDPREFKRREQAYNDSLNLFLSSEKQKEALRSTGYNPLGNTPWSGGIASHPTIKPVQEEAWGKNGITSTWIDVYEKPVQPVVYEPRPIQTPIQLDREEGLLESNPINLGDINPIPFESGSYFTRKRKPQEADRGKMEYFDKKTGRSIGLYDDGGELPEAGSGYKVVRSSERKGKTHKVTGPDGTVKFFGDSKLGQHPKDPARKKAFYARHKKNLAGNPYFRAFARKTWEEGGELNDWEILDTAQDGKKTYKKIKKQEPSFFYSALDYLLPGTPVEDSYKIYNIFADLVNKRVEYNKKNNLPLDKMSPEEIQFRENVSQGTPDFGYPSIFDYGKISESILKGKKYNESAPDEKTKSRRELKKMWLGIDEPDGKNKGYWIQSEYKPKDSTNPNAFYYKPKDIPNFSNEEFEKLYNLTNKFNFPGNAQNILNAIFPKGKSDYSSSDISLGRFLSGWGGNQLGNFKLGAGEDEKGKYVSVYDVWDLFPPQLKDKGIDIQQFGNSPEIYYRIYQPEHNLPYKEQKSFPGQSVPTMDFAQGGMLPDLNVMAFGGNLILEKYQEGGQKDIYKRPILSKIEEDPNINRSYYDPKLDIIYAGADYAKMTPEQKNKLLAHENYHAYQFKNDKATYLPVKDIPFAKPSMVSTPEIWNSYYNRKPIEVETDIYDFKSVNPSFQFVPEHLIFDKVVDPGQYGNPYTMEGEADFYENTGKDFMKNGGSVWEMIPDNEWEVLNEKPSYQKGGKVVSEIWQEVTGTPWSEAKKLGLTKGGYDENLAIRAELLKNPEKFISLVKEYSGKTNVQPTAQQRVYQQPVEQPIVNKYNSFAARSFSQPYFERDTYQEAAPSPNVQQPLPTYQWSNQQRVAPNLAAGDTPVATPRKAAPPKIQRVAITQRLPDLPLITNPITSPYFQAPIESTKVVPQMIKKGKQDSSIIQSIVDTINKSEFLQDVKDTIGNVKDVEDVKNSLIRGLGKTGLYSPNTEEVEPMKVPTQKPIIQPIAKPIMNSSAVQDTTPTTYYQGKGIVDPKTGTNIGRYVNTFSNWKGQEYIPTKSVGEWKKDKTTQYPSSQIAHYLLDTDLTTGYQHEYSKNYIESQKKGESITKGSTLKEQWLPVYEKLPNGNVRMKYKTNKELTKDDKIAAPLRQYKFGDLDWNSDIKSSWNKSSSALKTKSGDETNMIKSGKDMSGYGQFGGGSFVLISKRKNGEIIVRELAGSLQDLKNQAEDLAKMTGQNVNEVVVGYHDVGSWSAKPSSKNKKMGYSNIPKKNKNEFHSYQEDYTGAGLAFPFAYGGLTKSNWEIIK